MNDYNNKIKKDAMKRTGYSTKKVEIKKGFGKIYKNTVGLVESRDNIKNNIDECIGTVELSNVLYKYLENLISGIDKTNVRFCIERIIDDVINKNIPSNMKAKFTSIKDELEELLKLTDLDVSKVKDIILVAVKNKIYNNIMDEAEYIYKKIYFPSGNSSIKKAYSGGEIAKWLRNKNSINKLKEFTNKMTTVTEVIGKVAKVVKMSARAIKVFNSYAEGTGIKQRQNELKTSKDYKEYYYKVAQEAAQIASVLKSFSSKLPMGMRDYFEFIFTVAENTDKMAKVVYDYVGRLEKAMEEAFKDSDTLGSRLGKHKYLIEHPDSLKANGY